MIGAVNSGSSGWAGGSYTPSGRPTNVGGGGFGSPGTANGGPPPGVPSSSIIEARNNRGSNIRIPYARERPQLEPPPHAHTTHTQTRGARGQPDTDSRSPVAGLVPLHSREARDGALVRRDALSPKDTRVVFVDGKPAMEYDGLHLGELAWILGRRFKAVSPSAGGAGVEPYKRSPTTGEILRNPDGTPVPNDAPGVPNPQTPNALDELSASSRYAHQANLGMGTGVDRMQRLASQPWVENMLMQKLGNVQVHLHAIRPGSDYATMMDSSLFELKDLLAGSTALHVNDVTMLAQARAQIPIDKRVVEQKQGIMLLDFGPFLRGCQFSTDAIDVPEPSIAPPFSYSGGALGRKYAMPRNMGDNCAFAALNTELRRRNIFDWTPDGVVLSKLESPTDEPMKSTELDAREAQLFNVAVQGPAISTTWTADIRDHKLLCQPMDRVFVCLVAELSVAGVDEGDGAIKKELDARNTETEKLIDAYDRLEAARRAGPVAAVQAEKARADLEKARSVLTGIGAKIEALGEGTKTPAEEDEKTLLDTRNAYTTALNEYKKVESLDDGVDAKTEAKAALVATTEALTKVTEKYNAQFDWNAMDDETRTLKLGSINGVQTMLRKGDMHFKRAILTKFRYMRTTSAHLANYSHFDTANPNSRCGLKFGILKNGRHTAEYIVGAWCIGTVIDSAASRAHVGQMIRTAPTSMALNVNVNVEWWSGDKLYKHYMDNSGLVERRGQPPPMGYGIEGLPTPEEVRDEGDTTITEAQYLSLIHISEPTRPY